MGNTVLVVDRDQDFLQLMELVLVEEGYVVISCADPASAYENARQFGPFVALIDLPVRGQAGWQLIEQLRKDPLTAEMHIVVCTTSPTDLNLRPSRIEQWGLEVLHKPFDLTDLLHLLVALHTQCPKH